MLVPLLQDYSKPGRLTPRTSPKKRHQTGMECQGDPRRTNDLFMYTAHLFLNLIFYLGVLKARRTDSRYLPKDAPIRVAFHGTPQGKHPKHLGARFAAISAARCLRRLLHRVDRKRQEFHQGVELRPSFSTQDPGLPSPGGRTRFGLRPGSIHQQCARHAQRSVPASRGGTVAGVSSAIAFPLLAAKMHDNV
jgi:hypothetical protein